MVSSASRPRAVIAGVVLVDLDPFLASRFTYGLRALRDLLMDDHFFGDFGRLADFRHLRGVAHFYRAFLERMGAGSRRCGRTATLNFDMLIPQVDLLLHRLIHDVPTNTCGSAINLTLAY